jgi:hypothetical protein
MRDTVILAMIRPRCKGTYREFFPSCRKEFLYVPSALSISIIHLITLFTSGSIYKHQLD